VEVPAQAASPVTAAVEPPAPFTVTRRPALELSLPLPGAGRAGGAG